MDEEFITLKNEFAILKAQFAAVLKGQVVRKYHAAPAKPDDRFLVFADGTDWNPGSGAGVYRYNEATSSWVFLG